MRAFQHNKVFRGTFGKVWVDGERLSNVKSFEAKAALDYEDMNVNGDFGKKTVHGLLYQRNHDPAQVRLFHP